MPRYHLSWREARKLKTKHARQEKLKEFFYVTVLVSTLALIFAWSATAPAL